MQKNVLLYTHKESNLSVNARHKKEIVQDLEILSSYSISKLYKASRIILFIVAFREKDLVKGWLFVADDRLIFRSVCVVIYILMENI